MRLPTRKKRLLWRRRKLQRRRPSEPSSSLCKADFLNKGKRVRFYSRAGNYLHIPVDWPPRREPHSNLHQCGQHRYAPGLDEKDLPFWRGKEDAMRYARLFVPYRGYLDISVDLDSIDGSYHSYQYNCIFWWRARRTPGRNYRNRQTWTRSITLCCNFAGKAECASRQSKR